MSHAHVYIDNVKAQCLGARATAVLPVFLTMARNISTALVAFPTDYETASRVSSAVVAVVAVNLRDNVRSRLSSRDSRTAVRHTATNSEHFKSTKDDTSEQQFDRIDFQIKNRLSFLD